MHSDKNFLRLFSVFSKNPEPDPCGSAQLTSFPPSMGLLEEVFAHQDGTPIILEGKYTQKTLYPDLPVLQCSRPGVLQLSRSGLSAPLFQKAHCGSLFCLEWPWSVILCCIGTLLVLIKVLFLRFGFLWRWSYVNKFHLCLTGAKCPKRPPVSSMSNFTMTHFKVPKISFQNLIVQYIFSFSLGFGA